MILRLFLGLTAFFSDTTTTTKPINMAGTSRATDTPGTVCTASIRVGHAPASAPSTSVAAQADRHYPTFQCDQYRRYYSRWGQGQEQGCTPPLILRPILTLLLAVPYGQSEEGQAHIQPLLLRLLWSCFPLRHRLLDNNDQAHQYHHNFQSAPYAQYFPHYEHVESYWRTNWSA